MYMNDWMEHPLDMSNLIDENSTIAPTPTTDRERLADAVEFINDLRDIMRYDAERQPLGSQSRETGEYAVRCISKYLVGVANWWY